MGKVQTFHSEKFGVIRVTEVDWKIWFCVDDVTRVLDYGDLNKEISDHLKRTVLLELPEQASPFCSPYGHFTTEGEIFRLIANSDSPLADEFESWIFDKIIPDIRKQTPLVTKDQIGSPDFIIQLATAWKDEKGKCLQLEKDLLTKSRILSELSAKDDYIDLVLAERDLVSMDQIARDYDMPCVDITKLLQSLFQKFEDDKRCDRGLPISLYRGLGQSPHTLVGITKADGTALICARTIWTQKGRLFLYELLKANGKLPLIEQAAKKRKGAC